MALKDIWIDKIDDADDILAEHINSVAHAVIDNEIRIEEHNQTLSDIKKTTDNHEARIAEIEEHLAPKYIITDDKTAYRKDVPANACSKAQLNSIGGMTYKSNNLFDGLMTAGAWLYGNGAFSGSSENYVTNKNKIPIISGKQYTLSFYFNGKGTMNGIVFYKTDGTLLSSDSTIRTNPYTFTAPNEASYFCFNVFQTGITVDDVDWVMLNEGATALPYEPCFEGLHHSAVTELKAYGKNHYSGEQNIELYGASPSKTTIFTADIGETVTFSYKWSGTRVNSAGLFVLTLADGTTQNIPPTILSVTAKGIRKIALPNWCGVTGNVYDIQLEYGSTATEYIPYAEPKTVFQIPAEIQALPNYGKMFTKLDLVNKKFIDEYAEVAGVVSWNENPVSVFEIWGEDPNNPIEGYDCSVQFMRGDLSDSGDIGPVITEKPYDSIEYVGTQFILRKRVAQLNSFGSDDNYEIAEELFGKVTIVAKSLTETQEDISAYIDDNIIKVTAGGAIEFVNNDKKAVPSSVSFMMGGHLLEKEV